MFAHTRKGQIAIRWIAVVRFAPALLALTFGTGCCAIAAAQTAPATPPVATPSPPDKSLLNDHKPFTSLAMSPDGRLIAAARLENHGDLPSLMVWDAADGHLVFSKAEYMENDLIDFSADSKQLLLHGGAYRRLVLATGEMRRLDTTKATNEGNVFDLSGFYGAFRSDARQAVVVTRAGIEVWDVDAGTCIRKLANTAARLYLWPIALSQDGRTVTVIDANGQTRMIDLSQGTFGAPLGERGGPPIRLIVSADGRTQAVQTKNGAVRVRRMSDGALLLALPSSDGTARPFALNPQGTVLADFMPAGEQFRITFWDLASGKSLKQVRVYRELTALSFSPDGKRLLGAEQDRVLLWDVDAGRALRDFPAPRN
jgi:WD40 repeat protein